MAAPAEGTSGSEGRRGPGVAVVVALCLAAALVGGLVVAVARLGTRDADSAQAFCTATDVADAVLPSVVTIVTKGGGGTGNGSGELVRTGGYILTNDHVIAPGVDGTISIVYSDGLSTPATVVGRDPLTDLAVIKAEDGAPERPVVEVGDSTALRVGQPVVALGSPLGLNGTVTAGIVGALDRQIPVPAGEGTTAQLIDAIQTDASINPGNSGGALVDCDGRLVGINTAIATVPAAGGAGGGSVGLGFAIPSAFAIPIADELIANGQVSHPTFGMHVQTLPTLPNETGSGGVFQHGGLLVMTVAPGGPADQAGLLQGDVITALDGSTATTADQLTVLALSKQVGDSVTIDYRRNGEPMTTQLTLGAPD